MYVLLDNEIDSEEEQNKVVGFCVLVQTCLCVFLRGRVRLREDVCVCGAEDSEEPSICVCVTEREEMRFIIGQICL